MTTPMTANFPMTVRAYHLRSGDVTTRGRVVGHEWDRSTMLGAVGLQATDGGPVEWAPFGYDTTYDVEAFAPLPRPNAAGAEA